MEEFNFTTNIKSWYEKIRAYYFSHKQYRARSFFLFVIFVTVICSAVLVSPPKNFPLGNVVTIHSGDSLQEISNNLKSKNVIRSVFVFRTTAILFGGEKKIIAGDYLLDKKENALALAYRFIRGSFHLETVKITIPEGWNSYKIAGYLSNKLVKFDQADFLMLAKQNEGYLFPDTYFVSATAKPNDIVNIMKDNFNQKVLINKQIASSTRSLSDIVTMASILEGEAMPDDRQTVAGILWKRLSLGMPLQVDSTFSYINAKSTYDLTVDDLKIDSPYNTYIYKGLPPTPIDNPGMDSLLAAVTPTKTNYLYFLTEKDGTIHYAVTLSEQEKNVEKYLK